MSSKMHVTLIGAGASRSGEGYGISTSYQQLWRSPTENETRDSEKPGRSVDAEAHHAQEGQAQHFPRGLQLPFLQRLGAPASVPLHGQVGRLAVR